VSIVVVVVVVVFVVVVVVFVVVVAGLAIALAVPCVHHLMVWKKGKNEIPRYLAICTRDIGKNAAIYLS
jgi:hypothetical protein